MVIRERVQRKSLEEGGKGVASAASWFCVQVCIGVCVPKNLELSPKGGPFAVQAPGKVFSSF